METDTGCRPSTGRERMRGLRSDRSVQRAPRRAGATRWPRLDGQPRDGMCASPSAGGRAAATLGLSEPLARALRRRSGARHLLGPAERAGWKTATVVAALVRLEVGRTRAAELLGAAAGQRAGMSPQPVPDVTAGAIVLIDTQRDTAVPGRRSAIELREEEKLAAPNRVGCSRRSHHGSRSHRSRRCCQGHDETPGLVAHRRAGY